MTETAALQHPRKLRIILVDDEQLLLELWGFFIQNWFKEVELITLENGDAVWPELMRAKPDLLITDLYHPGMSGEAMIIKLAELQVKFPVLFTTAELDLPPNYAHLGIRVFLLPKPFGLEELWQALNELVGPCDFPANHLDSSKT